MLINAIYKKWPERQVSIEREDINHITWHDGLPAPSDEEILDALAAYQASQKSESYISAVQAHMDATARALGYDDIKTAVTYAEEPAVLKFQQEGQAFRAWRSLAWSYAFSQITEIEAGQRGYPTLEDFLLELPTLILGE